VVTLARSALKKASHLSPHHPDPPLLRPPILSALLH
jgi:hypothetical protein